MRKFLLTTFFALLPMMGWSQHHQPFWEPHAPGVEGDAARLPITNFFPALNESGRRNLKPRVVLAPEGRAMLVVHSQAPSTFTGESGFLALESVANTGWRRHGSGIVWTLNGMAVPRGYSVTSGRRQTALTVPAIPAGELATNLFGTFSRPGQPWSGMGGSLASGGLTQSNTFTPTVQQAMTAVDSFDNPYIGWTFGGNNQTSIHAGRWFIGSWQGFGGPITNPIHTTPEGFRILSVAMTFTGGAPVVVFSESNGTQDRVRALRFRSTDSQWVAMGNPQEGLGFGRHVQAINDRNDTRFYVGFENLTNGELKILEWNGSQFIPRPGAVEAWGLERMSPRPATVSTQDASIPANHALAFDHRGFPTVAFRAQHPSAPGKFHLYVSIMNPFTGVWTPIGNVGNHLGASNHDYTIMGPGATGHRHPSLAFTLDNRPVLAWELDTGANTGPVLQVRRYSRGLGDGLPNRRQGAARLLGLFDRDTLFDSRMLTANSDTILDAADITRLPR